MREQKRFDRRRNDRLLKLLRQQGRSVTWFAKQMGVSRVSVWRVETGDAGAPLDWYDRAAVILGVRVEDVSPEELVAA